MEVTKDTPGVIAPPPLIYLGGLAAGLVLDWLLPSASLPNTLSLLLGIALLIAGLTLMSSFIGAFRRAGTSVPTRRPTTAIVTTGPYRFSRNPGYFGMALVFSGIAVLAEALWAFAALAGVLLLIRFGVIAREERYLERKFGDEYTRYKSRVRRWI
jgi:protein-S-isoprenylcysteine O-methyltransferase Ste14